MHEGGSGFKSPHRSLSDRTSFIKHMWKGRFSQDTSSLVQQFGESISYDWRLFPHDIAGSIAHARAQLNAGLLSGG